MKSIIFLMLFLFGCGFVYAQEDRVLSLPEAVSYALEHKAAAEKARLDVKKADAQIAEVRANALPHLNVNAGTTFNPLLQETVLPGEIFGMPGQNVTVAFGQKWTSSATAQLTQVLFNQSVFTGLKAAKSTKEFYRLNAQLTKEEIIEKVATAYYQVFQAKQLLENLESNIDLTEKTVDIVRGLFEAGLAKEIDYDRSRVALNNLLAQKQQLVNAVQLSQNALKFMIGMPIDAEIQLPEQTLEPSVLAGESIDFLADRTELQLQNKRLELLRLQKEATAAQYYPTASLVANYGYLGQGDEVPLWNGEEKGIFWSDLASVGINIQIPIFNGFATRSKVTQNQIEVEKAEADLRETKLALELAYENALAQLENNLITIRNQEENVELAQKVLNNIQNNYSLGLATLNDLLDAERDLSNAKNQLTQAKLDYKLAEIQLLKSQGNLDTLNPQNL